MVSYLSLLKLCDENDNCNQYLIKYELQLKLTEITPLFNELKTYIEMELKKYRTIFKCIKKWNYLSYIDGNLVLK